MNYVVMNKKQSDEIKFSPEKKHIHHLSFTASVDGLCYKKIDSSILQEIFISVSKCSSCNGEHENLS